MMYKNTKIYNPIYSLIVFLVIISILFGCASKYYLRSKADLANIKRIAVLPFENFSSDKFAHEKIRRMVITELLSKGFDVIEPGEVTSLLREMKVWSVGAIKTTEIQEIGKRLNVEAVMRGSVECFGISRGISVSYPEVTIDLMLIDTSTGKIIWSVRHTSGGASFWTRHFGSEGMSLSETARKAVSEALETLY